MALGGGSDHIQLSSGDYLGHDTIYGGSGMDTVEITSDATISDDAWSNVTNVHDLLLSGTGAQHVEIGTHADSASLHNIDATTGHSSTITIDSSSTLDHSVSTGVGNDSLTAGSGNDTLHGGAGADTMVAGSGHDVFHYSATGDSNSGSVDNILNWTPGHDRLAFQVTTSASGRPGVLTGSANVLGRHANGHTFTAQARSIPENGQLGIAQSHSRAVKSHFVNCNTSSVGLHANLFVIHHTFSNTKVNLKSFQVSTSTITYKHTSPLSTSRFITTSVTSRGAIHGHSTPTRTGTTTTTTTTTQYRAGSTSTKMTILIHPTSGSVAASDIVLV